MRLTLAEYAQLKLGILELLTYYKGQKVHLWIAKKRRTLCGEIVEPFKNRFFFMKVKITKNARGEQELISSPGQALINDNSFCQRCIKKVIPKEHEKKSLVIPTGLL